METIPIRIGKDDYERLKVAKNKTGIKSYPTIIKLALDNYFNSKEYKRLLIGLK